ncbi:MAG TPA: Trp family transcriptional regulator [Candidatus Peribacteraceae bacterium]|nr:Trp family transcriptional regulator [Candidatus Peribacteraceae bacterium]
MSKVTVQKLSIKGLQSVEEELWMAIKEIKSADGLLTLLRLLLTESERIMCGRRIQIAKLLLAGCSHKMITEKLKVGLTTVQNTERWLREAGEYHATFPDLYAEFRTLKSGQFIKKYGGSFTSLQKKYPLHFLLFSLLIDQK